MCKFKMITLHDRYDGEPIIVRPDIINMIRKSKEDGNEYSTIFVEGFSLDIKENIGEVLSKIKKIESEEN